MDFDKIKAFIVVAEELNFRKSAEILGMSQPPLTRLIANLEKELDAKLFERSTRSVKLTAAGVVFLKEAKEIEAALGRIQTEVRAAGKIKSGVLRVGFSRTAFMARFPEIVEEFQERFPKIKLELTEGPSKEILKGVEAGRFDCGFVEGISTFQQLKSHEVNSENLGALLPAKHPLAKRSELQLSDLANETIILHHKREAEEFHNMVAKLFAEMPKRPKIYIKQDTEACPILVATGKGVSLTIAGSQNIAPRQTRFVPIKGLFLPVRIFWKKEGSSAQLNTFLSFVLENRTLVQSDTQCLVLSEI